MPQEPSHRPRSTSMPSIVWAILGVMLVALFVLLLGLLNGAG
jgi:hypothetical protein